MLPTLHRLIWKEFHELKWSVVATSAIALTVPLCYSVRDPGMAVFAITFTFFVYPVLAGAFFGAHAAAGERVHRVAPLLAALPIRTPVLGCIKLAATLVATLIPLLLLVLLAALLSRFGSESDRLHPLRLWIWYGFSSLITAHMVIIVAAVGAGRSTEVLAAITGLAAVAIWAFAAVFTAVFTNSDGHIFSESYSVAAEIVRGIGPPYDMLRAMGGHPSEMARPPSALRVLLFAISLFGLAALFVSRYHVAIQSKAEWGLPNWRRPQRAPTVQGSLLWKDLCEIAPFSLLVIGIVVLLSAIAGLSDGPRGAAGSLAALSCFAGFVLALLLGVGSFVTDLQPAVNIFWRSRPISPNRWFWTRYGVGLAAILLTLGLPPLAAAVLVGGPIAIGEILTFVAVWIAVYSLVVTATCLVRHTVHAAILGAGATGLIYAAVEICAGSAFALGGSTAPLTVLFPVFLLTFLVATIAAWWVAVHDIAVSR